MPAARRSSTVSSPRPERSASGQLPIHVGTAGWVIPAGVRDQFPADGSSLERYASRMGVAEINSSFHKSHRISTWQRWRDSVPPEFRFSVKLPKTVTHAAGLQGCSELVDEFLSEANQLEDRLGVLLVQLPPKLAFDGGVARQFFTSLSARSPARIACEPRHQSWFSGSAQDLLEKLGIARVAADPAICTPASVPGGWPGLRYWRLHGSPSKYRSSYADRISSYAGRLVESAAAATPTWCIFDNTASSAALADALLLARALRDLGAAD